MRSDRQLPIRSIVVDFDGTIAIDDASEGLFEAFAEPGWKALSLAFERGEIGSRECIVRQAALVRGTPETMVAFAVETFRLDPTFAPFIDWAGAAGIEVSVASDGIGLHVAPLLDAAGITGLPIVTNRAVPNDVWRMEFPNAHPECVYCGTCKMNATLAARGRAGPTAFVGDGSSDRFGALYADFVFAKRSLAEYCRDAGVPFVEWETFDDVRWTLEADIDVPGPLDPAVCPGWTLPETANRVVD